MPIALLVALLLLSLLALALWQRQRGLRRQAYIRQFELPRGLFEKLRQHHPGLSLKDCQLVAQALRQFFLANLKSGRVTVAMPSLVVDELWHEFILYTRNYEAFCQRAFGRFLHHTPAVVLGPQRDVNAGLRRCFWHACREENIDPRQPTRLPLLFAIDAKLKVAGGFHYTADCERLRARAAADGGDGGGSVAVYCGADFSSEGYDGGTEGLGEGSSSGGGDGGGGCGGGGE
jgi:hypothetical protein